MSASRFAERQYVIIKNYANIITAWIKFENNHQTVLPKWFVAIHIIDDPLSVDHSAVIMIWIAFQHIQRCKTVICDLPQNNWQDSVFVCTKVSYTTKDQTVIRQVKPTHRFGLGTTIRHSLPIGIHSIC